MAKTSGHHAKVLVGGYDLSALSNNLEIGEQYDAHDVAGFEAVHHFVPGQKTTTFTHQGLFEQGTAHAALKAPGGSAVITALVGQNAAPAVGDPVFLFNTYQGNYSVQPSNAAAVPFSAEYHGQSDSHSRWGVALTPPVTITDTTQGTSVDHGASSSNGGIATLHVLTAAATDTYSVKVRHSPDDSTWADLVTFTLDGSAIGGEFQTVAAGTTVDRYLRYEATRTGAAGDDFELAVAFARL